MIFSRENLKVLERASGVTPLFSRTSFALSLQNQDASSVDELIILTLLKERAEIAQRKNVRHPIGRLGVRSTATE